MGRLRSESCSSVASRAADQNATPRSRSSTSMTNCKRRLRWWVMDLLGISWGGGLAQQFALSQRDRCRRLVLVATGTGMLMVPGRPKVLARMATPRRYLDPGYAERIAADLYGGGIPVDPPPAPAPPPGPPPPGPRRRHLYHPA